MAASRRPKGASGRDPAAAAEASAALVTWLVVLGDFGRSPRMQYHAESLASKRGSQVHVVAYGGSEPLESLRSAANVRISYLPEVPRWVAAMPGLLRLMCKVLHQLFALAWLMLVALPAPRNILMQNPPAIPSLVLCWLAARRHRASLVVDWHNFGHSILALKHAPRGPLVRLARSHEMAWGAAADKAFCVTAAMKSELAERWGVRAAVLYDRPPAQFQRTPISDAHALLVRLAGSVAGCDGDFPASDFAADEAAGWGPGRTVATAAGGSPGAPPAWRADRPAILVSSTSWTPDEDFGVLLAALQMYERAASGEAAGGSGREHGALPNLLVFITGRGPQRRMYLEAAAALRMRRVAIRSVWLEAADYPLLLGLADLGVSLHASSSGLDLPMKVVDMFGSGLPVCALSYACIHELVEEGETGTLFRSAEQLCEQLQRLLRGFPGSPSRELSHMAAQVARKEQGLRWQENWDNVAWPLLQS